MGENTQEEFAKVVAHLERLDRQLEGTVNKSQIFIQDLRTGGWATWLIDFVRGVRVDIESVRTGFRVAVDDLSKLRPSTPGPGVQAALPDDRVRLLEQLFGRVSFCGVGVYYPEVLEMPAAWESAVNPGGEPISLPYQRGKIAACGKMLPCPLHSPEKAKE